MLVGAHQPFTLDWAAAAERHHDVLRVTLARTPVRERPESLLCRHAWQDGLLRVDLPRVPTSAVRELVTAAGLGRVVRAERAAGRPVDLVHAHFHAGAAGVRHLKRALGIPFVVTEHSTTLTGQSVHAGKALSADVAERAARVYRAADGVCAVSPFLAEALRSNGLLEDVAVIPNPVDTELFQPGPLEGRRGEETLLVSCGRLEADKRPGLLLEVLERLNRDGAYRLLLVGEGPEREALLAQAHRIGVADKLDLVGRQSRAWMAERWRESADVYVSAAPLETFGMAVAEALSAGLPTVIGSGNALDGFAAAPGVVQYAGTSVEAVAAAVRRALVQRAPTGDAHKWLHERFSYDAVGQLVAQWYRGAVADGSRMDSGARRPAPRPVERTQQ